MRRAENRIRISLLAVDTDGVTNVAISIAKPLEFDLCPRSAAGPVVGDEIRQRDARLTVGWACAVAAIAQSGRSTH